MAWTPNLVTGDLKNHRLDEKVGTQNDKNPQHKNGWGRPLFFGTTPAV